MDREKFLFSVLLKLKYDQSLIDEVKKDIKNYYISYSNRIKYESLIENTVKFIQYRIDSNYYVIDINK